ncbi:tail fiber domain-containing protein [Ralstonia sp. UBA689]|uniref:tail fiber domain-containing protein n=1 Tax=Ralstonia sp. UBA689 TaxID=1947373 RepID=UPI0025DD9E9F|nr:tail fiber domain-containing protein [Ralstonia sp. UBA689]
MSGGGGSTTTVQKSDPWSGQQPYLENVFSGAQNAYNQYAGNPSSSVARFTPMQQQAIGATQGVANGTNFGNAANVNNAAGGYTTNLLNGNYLNSNPGNAAFSKFSSGDMMNNPYMTGMANAATDSITRAYQTATAPQTASAFAGSGRYGSGAYQNQVSQNQQDLATQLGNSMNSLYGNMYQNNMSNMLQGAQGLSQNYNTASQQQLAGAANAPNIVNSVNSGISNLHNMGGNQQALQQNQLNAPWQQLNNFSNLIQGQYGSNVTASEPYFQNQMAGALGGAVNGAALGTAFGGGYGYGTGIGAALGGAMGAFSDRRLKLDVEATGEHLANGLPLYSFRYLWDEPNIRRRGVMADEVRKVAPHAVWRDPSGFDAVDYAAVERSHVLDAQ